MLVSLDDIQTYLGLTDSELNEYEDFLVQQEKFLSSTVQNYCGRLFSTPANWKQTFYLSDFDNTNRVKEIFLYHYPVNSITEIKEGDETITDYRMQSDGRIVRTDGYENRKYWFLDDNKLEVTYNAGYAATPDEVALVILNLIEERYNKKKAGINVNFGNNVQSVAIPGVMNIQFDYTLQSNERSVRFGMILGDWVNVLDHFRTERVLGSRLHQQLYIESV